MTTTWADLTHLPGARAERPLAAVEPLHGVLEQLRMLVGRSDGCGNEACPACSR